MHRDPQSALRRAVERDAGAVRGSDAPDDRQAEPRARLATVGATIEAIEDALSFGLGNARAGVIDDQPRASRIGRNHDLDPRPPRRIACRVVRKVADQQAERNRVAVDASRRLGGEFEPDTAHPVIALIDEWQDADGSIQKRHAKSDLGGTMRLGAQSSDVAPNTLAHQIYGKVVTERHRHRYEANEHYLDRLREAGLVISAITQREKLTEIVELPQTVHPWFVGVQFHPEFKSTPWDGHPLFISYVKAALDHQRAAQAEKVAA